jgi:hypothetical protein
MEELVWHAKTGARLTHAPPTYKIPTANDGPGSDNGHSITPGPLLMFPIVSTPHASSAAAGPSAENAAITCRSSWRTASRPGSRPLANTLAIASRASSRIQAGLTS